MAYHEDFESDIALTRNSAWLPDTYPDSDPFSDAGAYFRAQGVVPLPGYRLSVPLGTDGWLRAESYTRYVATELGELLAVVPDPGGASNRALRPRSPAHTDATVVRPSQPLPPRYRVSLRVGFADFGDGLPGSDNGYDGGERAEPWRDADATRQNGFYWLAILDTAPVPHNNIWIHHHRKVVVDFDNHYPPWMEIFNGTEFIPSGERPIMLFGVDGQGSAQLRAGKPFLSWSAGQIHSSGAIRAVDSYLPNTWYRASIERTEHAFVVEISGVFRYGGARTYRVYYNLREHCLWHYNRPGERARPECIDETPIEGSHSPAPQWPAGAGWPDYFIFGDPHINYLALVVPRGGHRRTRARWSSRSRRGVWRTTASRDSKPLARLSRIVSLTYCHSMRITVLVPAVIGLFLGSCTGKPSTSVATSLPTTGSTDSQSRATSAADKLLAAVPAEASLVAIIDLQQPAARLHPELAFLTAPGSKARQDAMIKEVRAFLDERLGIDLTQVQAAVAYAHARDLDSLRGVVMVRPVSGQLKGDVSVFEGAFELVIGQQSDQTFVLSVQDDVLVVGDRDSARAAHRALAAGGAPQGLAHTLSADYSGAYVAAIVRASDIPMLRTISQLPPVDEVTVVIGPSRLSLVAHGPEASMRAFETIYTRAADSLIRELEDTKRAATAPGSNTGTGISAIYAYYSVLGYVEALRPERSGNTVSITTDSSRSHLTRVTRLR